MMVIFLQFRCIFLFIILVFIIFKLSSFLVSNTSTLGVFAHILCFQVAVTWDTGWNQTFSKCLRAYFCAQNHFLSFRSIVKTFHDHIVQCAQKKAYRRTSPPGSYPYLDRKYPLARWGQHRARCVAVLSANSLESIGQQEVFIRGHIVAPHAWLTIMITGTAVNASSKAVW